MKKYFVNYRVTGCWYAETDDGLFLKVRHDFIFDGWFILDMYADSPTDTIGIRDLVSEVAFSAAKQSIRNAHVCCERILIINMNPL